MSVYQVSAYQDALHGVFTPWIKVPYTIFVGFLIPVYWARHGPSNFLWFSDIALFGTMIALWFGWRLLAGMMALAVLLPEIAWNIGFFSQLFDGPDLFGLAGYMFDPSTPLHLRGLSLFHVALPPLLVWMLFRLGYDARALPAQTALAWVVLPLSYVYARAPDHNINWTLGIGGDVPQAWMPDWLWVLLLMVAFPLLLYYPTHLLLRRWFRHPH